MVRYDSIETKNELTTLELINNIQQGISIFNGKLELVECNSNYLKIMNFPEEFSKPGTPFFDLLLYNAKLGIYGEGNPEELAQNTLDFILSKKEHIYDRELMDGRIVQINGNFTDDGWLINTYSDVTSLRLAEREDKSMLRTLDQEIQKQVKKIIKTELKLNQQNKTLLEIVENTNHGISFFDKNLDLVACNERFLSLMEFPKEFKDTSKNLEDFFRYNAERGEYGDGDIEEQIRMRMALSRNFEAHKFERTRPDGTVLEIIGTPINSGFVTTYSDITELRQTQNKLEEASENLQAKVDEQTKEIREKQERSEQLITAFDALHESVAIVDEEDRFVFTNKRYQVVNEPVKDALAPGTYFEDYLKAIIDADLVPESEGPADEWLKNRMARHHNPTGPFELARQDGIWLLVSEQKLDHGGTIMLGTDISERKQAEEALRESEELLRATAENLPEVFWISNIDENAKYSMKYVNPAFERIWQRKREELYADTSVWFSCMHPDDKERVAQAADDFYREKRPYEEEFRITPPDGTERTIYITGELIKDIDGNIVRAAGIARDITDHKQMEQQVRRSQKMDAVGQLTGGIAHDFNNILGIVQGNLELLEALVGDNEKASKRVEMALKGVDRGVNITKKLLGFSSRDAQQALLGSVNDYVANLVNLIAKSLTASVKVETHLAEDLWTVAIDPGDFEDSILNLSLNARDAMHEGGTLIIETSNIVLDEKYVECNPSSRPGEYVMISVSDTGEGMTDDVRDKIFEPFFTTKDTGKGTGLGLSMVYGFVKRSEGHIKVYSAQGKGTTFRIYLPRCTELKAAQHPAGIIYAELPRGDETILIVDDEDALREIACSHLKDLGYSVISAADAREALKILDEETPVDLLFSDVVMPGKMDGYLLAAAAHEKRPELDILLTSGFTKAQEIAKHGENEYLSGLISHMMSKPYSQASLAFTVRDKLDNKE